MTCDPNMEKVIGAMQTQSDKVSQGLFVDSNRQWFDFRDVKEAGKFEFDKVHEIFDRSTANSEYLKLRQSAGALAGDMQTAKLSVEYLSVLERDYRMRNRSRVRNFVHAGVRMWAKGLDVGPIRAQGFNWLPAMQKETAEKGGEA